MDSVTIGYIIVGVMVLLLFSGLPIGAVMALMAVIGILLISGPNAALGLIQRTPYDVMASYDLSIVPLFMLMGEFCFFAGISGDLYKAVHHWIGHMRGGLALATIGACALFGAVSGSSLAAAATFTSVALPEMKRYGYKDSLSTGAIAAGGTLAILIPPSIVFVIYGIITQQSIGKLLLSGLIPGILLALLYMVVIYIQCTIDPHMGPPGPKTTTREKFAALKGVWIVGVLFMLVIGGMYFGWFNPSEAAGIGAFGAFIFALANRKLSSSNFIDSLKSTSKNTGMIFVIVIGAYLLNSFLASSKMPMELSNTLVAMEANRYLIFAIIVIIYIFLGMIMDSMGMVLITVPIFFPIMMKLGFDPIWFGCVVVMVCEMGQITPPVGINVFVVAGMAKDVPMYTIFRGIIPFFIADVFVLILITIFPPVAIWLPYLLK
jgi:C4-dicarboxylate transporter DctM subunit